MKTPGTVMICLLVFISCVGTAIFFVFVILDDQRPRACIQQDDYLLDPGESCRRDFVAEVTPGVVMCRCKSGKK